jgi:hypothetical protein
MLMIVAPMHLHAHRYAKQQQIAEYKTATEARSLRGLSSDTPIIVVDSGVRFQDDAALKHVLLTRFTNVTHRKL